MTVVLLGEVVTHGARLDERLGDDPSEHLLRPPRPPVLEIEPAGAGRLPERPRLGRADALDQREHDVVLGQRCVCLGRDVQPAERSDDEERDRGRGCGSDTREREPGPDGRTSAAIRLLRAAPRPGAAGRRARARPRPAAPRAVRTRPPARAVPPAPRSRRRPAPRRRERGQGAGPARAQAPARMPSRSSFSRSSRAARSMSIWQAPTERPISRAVSANV